MDFSPIWILVTGIATVVGLILGLRLNAFISLIAAALVVSFMSPGAAGERVVRVAAAFGDTTAGIGIVIAMAAVIGTCMMKSGAADRIVRWILGVLGEKRCGTAMVASGFSLSIPVFFDTVFYLLVPLARSMYRRTGRRYVRYLVAIAAGGNITHTLVPPTPGPLIIADNLQVDLGLMILFGLAVGLPVAGVGLWFSSWIDRRMPVEMRPIEGQPEPEPIPDASLPPLLASWLPIVLPVLLIAANTIGRAVWENRGGSAPEALLAALAVIGNPNIALILSAAVALALYAWSKRPAPAEFSATIEAALMSGGLIILITAAGGAFGAMLKQADVGTALQAAFSGREGMGDFALLSVGFGMASVLKFAQGSTTVAMITASAMMATVAGAGGALPTVFLAAAIGGGSLVGSWMNDSGFWIFAKMGGLTEVETLKSWTPLLALIGVSSFVVTVLYAAVYGLVY